jgi:hypothetical protein
MKKFKQYIKENNEPAKDIPVKDIKYLYDFITKNMNHNNGISPDEINYTKASNLLNKYNLGVGNYTSWKQILKYLTQKAKELKDVNSKELDLFGTQETLKKIK